MVNRTATAYPQVDMDIEQRQHCKQRFLDHGERACFPRQSGFLDGLGQIRVALSSRTCCGRSIRVHALGHRGRRSSRDSTELCLPLQLSGGREEGDTIRLLHVVGTGPTSVPTSQPAHKRMYRLICPSHIATEHHSITENGASPGTWGKQLCTQQGPWYSLRR